MKLEIELNYWDKDNTKCYTKNCEKEPTNLIYCPLLLEYSNVRNVDDNDDLKKYLLVCSNCAPKFVKKAFKTKMTIQDFIKNL